MYDTTSYPCFSLSSHKGVRLDLDQLAMGLICLQLSGSSTSLVPGLFFCRFAVGGFTSLSSTAGKPVTRVSGGTIGLTDSLAGIHGYGIHAKILLLALWSSSSLAGDWMGF